MLTCGPRGRQRRGIVSAWVIVALPVLLGMLAVSIDLGCVCIARQQLQTAADAGALAGAGKLRWTTDEQAARADVQSVVQANAVLGQQLQLDPQSDVLIGTYDEETGAFVAGMPHDETPLVRVTLRRTDGSPGGPMPLAFARLFGIETVNVTASATAGFSASIHPRKAMETVILQDVSGSFRDELEDAKNADNALVDLVDGAAVDGDSFAVVCFRGAAVRESDLEPVPDATSSIHDAITSIQWGSDLPTGTHTGLGIDEAVAILDEQGSPDTRQVIVLISDGMPFGYAQGSMSEEEVTAYRRQYAIDAADAAAQRDIVIHTVTFVQEPSAAYEYGEAGADADFNAQLVRNGGYALHPPNPEDLEHILIMLGTIEVGHPRLIE